MDTKKNKDEIVSSLSMALTTFNDALAVRRFSDLPSISLSITNLTAALYNLREVEEDGRGEGWKD